MSGGKTLGEAFAEAFAGKDVSEIARLMHPQIDFHALTPKRTWRAKGTEQVVSDVIQPWFDDFDDGANLGGGEFLTKGRAHVQGYQRRQQKAFQGSTWLSARIASANLGAL